MRKARRNRDFITDDEEEGDNVITTPLSTPLKKQRSITSSKQAEALVLSNQGSKSKRGSGFTAEEMKVNRN